LAVHFVAMQFMRSTTLATSTACFCVSRGKLEMNIEAMIPDLDATILCCRNADNRGALSADTLGAMGYRNARSITGVLTWLIEHADRTSHASGRLAKKKQSGKMAGAM
jgi:hypothetical protein